MAKNTKVSGQENAINPEQFATNAAEIATRCSQIMQRFIEKQPEETSPLLAGMSTLTHAYSEMLGKLFADPTKFIDAQLEFYQDYLELLDTTSKRFMGDSSTLSSEERKDRRFHDEAWDENVLFNFIKQSYLLGSTWIQKLTTTVELDEKTEKIIDFYNRQMVDAMAPTNFLMTNPQVLRTTIETNGENLVKGLENLLEDLEQSKGVLQLDTADERAFTVGKNIATTKGSVIYENDLMQLIQYEPQTKEVYKNPVLIIAPWINKYYILDLQPENSFINWLVKKGHTVFIISWVNPTKKLSKKDFGDYMVEGPLAALQAIEKATGEKEVNVIAYCIGGTLMAATLAYLAIKKQEKIVKSVTYLTTLVDFVNPGDLGVFIDDAILEEMEEQMRKSGYLDGSEMSAVFSMLRANDMIWSTIINNYLLGKDPLPFDLLYWNADSTRLPAAMHSFYLRNMYRDNLLAKPGGIKLKNSKIDLHKIKTPSYILATKEDHIVPWQAAFKAMNIYRGKNRFVLSGSGHVGGVINPPIKKKYCYWTNSKECKTPTQWFSHSKKHDGSWWNDWQTWITKNGYAGKKVKSRKSTDSKLNIIEPAPGRYVKVRC